MVLVMCGGVCGGDGGEDGDGGVCVCGGVCVVVLLEVMVEMCGGGVFVCVCVSVSLSAAFSA